MADVVVASVRSRMMADIKAENTRPELMIRRAMHSRGYRYRLHDRSLAGSPDMVLRKYKAVIFVNGCFWHKHNCHLFKWPKTREEFWKNKINGNAERDIRNVEKLRSDGWRICRIWECALKGKIKLSLVSVADQCSQWLQTDKPFLDIQGEA